MSGPGGFLLVALAMVLSTVLAASCVPRGTPPRTGAVQPGGTASSTRPDSTVARWTASWGTAVQPAHDTSEPGSNWSEEGFGEETVRQIVRLSIGGPKLRVRLSNAYGTGPLRIAGMTVARSDGGAKARPGTLRALTFGGSPGTTVPAGKDSVTDEIALPTANREELAVTLRFAAPTGPATVHRFTTATSYRARGDHLWSSATPDFEQSSTHAWYYLTSVDVLAEPFGGQVPNALMVFGDSLFDGVGTRPGTDDRFSDKLVERLVAADRPRGMVNASLAGNSLLSDSPCYGPKGTARFAKELRERSGVRTVFIHLGGNDLATPAEDDPCLKPRKPVTAAKLIAGHRRLIELAHDHGVQAIGVTVLPMMGAVFPFTDAAGERARRQLNHWIRTSGEYDEVVDADHTMADPAVPTRSRPGYVSEDGLHPSGAGHLAISAQVDLNSLSG